MEERIATVTAVAHSCHVISGGIHSNAGVITGRISRCACEGVVQEAKVIFPVPYIPNENYRGGRGFGADRTAVAKLLKIPGGKLKHGAVDLIVPPKTPVLAMEDGVMLKGPYNFFLNVYAIEGQHSRFIARYCEISEIGAVRAGALVTEGQVIAYVGNQPGADMLHLELFPAPNPVVRASIAITRKMRRTICAKT